VGENITILAVYPGVLDCYSHSSNFPITGVQDLRITRRGQNRYDEKGFSANSSSRHHPCPGMYSNWMRMQHLDDVRLMPQSGFSACYCV
jgi:hypothetical protein